MRGWGEKKWNKWQFDGLFLCCITLWNLEKVCVLIQYVEAHKCLSAAFKKSALSELIHNIQLLPYLHEDSSAWSSIILELVFINF